MDDSSTCPKCGAAVRPAQEWCTLCLHVLHAPEPAPLVTVPSAVSVPVAADEPGQSVSSVQSGDPVEPDFDVEAAAEALLSQLAIDTKRDSFAIPAFLNSKGRIAVFVTAAMAVLSVACLATMGILGQLLG